jgi:SWI/SNF-related matrix-associated actin-dependent regulator 1 of chromatin subfamily A
MPARRSFRPKPAWQSAGTPILSLVREGGRVRVDFAYSPTRVKAIKAIQGARFHPDDKSWSIPFTAVESVISSKEFPPTQVLNGLGEPDVIPRSLDEAMKALRENPFKVDEETVSAVCPEVVIRLHGEKRRLRVVPRLGSTGHKLVMKSPGALFSAFDTAYVVPTERLGALLKRLRDSRVTFAVDVTAGEELARSASLRSEILESPTLFGSDQLAEALLVPFVTSVHAEPGGFRPCYFTSEQFRLAFPGVQRKGAQKPFVLDDKGLLKLSARLDALPFTVWLTREVHDFLDRKRADLMAEVGTIEGPLEDAALEVLSLPLMWRISSSGCGSLVIHLPPESDVRDLVVSRCMELLGTRYDNEAKCLIIEIPDSKVGLLVSEMTHLCEVHGLAAIPKSESFARLERDVAERTKLREVGAYYASLDDVPAESVLGLDVEHAARLFPHQRVAVQWLSQMPHAFLGDDMGLGKTLSVLSYFSALKRNSGFELLLVVCPNSLTRNWLREAKMWFPDLRATVLAGDKSSKAWALRLLTSGAIDYDVLVVNYEAVRLEYVIPELEKLTGQRKTLLCLDESQRVKNPQAKTFKALMDLAPKCSRRVLLSGTPTPKDVSDLWAQIRILDGGERFGKSFYKWLSSVAELGTEYSDFAVKKFNDEAVNESILRVHEIMLRRRKERVVNLPEKTFTVREIELSGSQRERYDEIREGLMLRMRALSGEQFIREITNILEEYLRAVQVASNPRLVDPLWKGEPAKFLELDEIVDEVVRGQGQKLVVWTNYLGNIRELTDRYKDLGAAAFSGEVSASDREATVRAFQEQETPRILVAVPAAGGVGITLTAAQTAVYIDKTWNAEHWMQSVDRIHRIGQRGTVNIISFLGCKVDEIIHWNLRRKERAQAEVLGDETRSGKDNTGRPSRAELLEALED